MYTISCYLSIEISYPTTQVCSQIILFLNLSDRFNVKSHIDSKCPPPFDIQIKQLFHDYQTKKESVHIFYYFLLSLKWTFSDYTNNGWLPPPLDTKCLILPQGSFKSCYPPIICQSLILYHVFIFRAPLTTINPHKRRQNKHISKYLSILEVIII